MLEVGLQAQREEWHSECRQSRSHAIYSIESSSGRAELTLVKGKPLEVSCRERQGLMYDAE